ncbi:MAG: helix-turn-helix transcriptional regulator, partial [Bacilli bacterium]
MNIEIANRLVELRKKMGLSQEELADKLGISRQAISKWERAEASPDTDNLICLAKIYGVSLDDLLKTDQPVEEVIRAVKEKENEQQEENVNITIEREIETK